MSLHQHICIRGQRSRDRNADDKNKTCCKPSRLRNVLQDAPLTRSAECFSKFRAAKERPREKEFGRRVGVKNSDSRVSFQCSVWLGFDAASPALFDEAATGQGSSGAVRLATRQMTRTCESMRTIQGPQRRCYASAAASNCEAARTLANWTRCLVPGFDGDIIVSSMGDALWAKFFTAAPRRQRQSVERYSVVKRA
jgi:hypothetical protein